MEKRIQRIIEVLDSKKAENIESFDLTGKGYIVNNVVIATALNSRHSLALLTNLKEALKPEGEEFVRTEEDGDWTIVDLGDILIHIMTQAYRDKYTLEDFLTSFKEAKEEF
ncbi:MAG: ribosome silencing factor [Epsilonproteobacteria bacterium]|nr:MAG: ribosome silencing factor [Campylobacterota bacterium]